MTTEPHQTPEGTAAALGAVVSWGMGPVLVKFIELSGMTLVFWRMWLGALTGIAILALRGRRLTRRTLRLAAPGGVTFAVNLLFFFTAVKHTTVTDAMIISALQPALVFVVVGRLFGEKLSIVDVAWTGVAILGVGGVVAGASAAAGRTLYGDLMAVGALVTWAWYFVASKAARRDLGALEYQAGLMLIGAVVVTPFVFLSHPVLLVRGGGDWLGIWALVCIPGGGHLLMNWAHAHTRLTVSSLLTLLSPIVSSIGAWLLVSERLTIAQLGAMAVVIGALAVVVLRMTRVPAGLSLAPVGVEAVGGNGPEPAGAEVVDRLG